MSIPYFLVGTFLTTILQELVRLEERITNLPLLHFPLLLITIIIIVIIIISPTTGSSLASLLS
jgi:hypothetical protein